jgi:hypothetical protein
LVVVLAYTQNKEAPHLTLQDFEQHIDKTILQRGRQYFKDGYVESLEQIDGEWVAGVSGSDDYAVTVTLDRAGRVTETECDCPYDWGEYCKHQVAVFYALREGKPRWQEKSKGESLASLLNKQDSAVLASILLEYTKKDKQIKEDLLFRFADHKDKPAYARKLIQNSIRQASRRGFVEYEDVYDAIQGANEALHMAEDALPETLTCVAICIVVLEEMMKLLERCDDSDGYVGGAIGDAMELIGKTTEAMPDNAPDAGVVFDSIISHLRDKVYDGWSDWRFILLKACFPFCNSSERRQIVEDTIALYEKRYGDKDYDRYDSHRAQELRLALILRYDGEDAAEQYMERHLENDAFRKADILKCIDKNQFDRALELCLDGEVKDVDRLGLVTGWKQLRYSIYEKKNDLPAQKSLAAEFIREGKFDYYLSWKSLYAKEDWPAELDNLLWELDDGAYHRQGIYVQILIHEQKKILLLAYAKKHINEIVGLHLHLLPEYKSEVADMLRQHILKSAAAASDRKMYQRVCEVIKVFRKACGSEGAIDVRDELLRLYPKRPAFADELRKVKRTHSSNKSTP